MNTQQQTNNTKLICQAIKKDGNSCKYKAKCNSKYCGVHKNYLDTSKPLFTEDEPDEGFTIKFNSMDHINHSVVINPTWTTSDVIKDLQDEASLNEAFKYSIFLEGNEEELDDTHEYNPKNNYFLMKGENQEFKKNLEAFKNNEAVKSVINMWIYEEFYGYEREYYNISDGDTFSDEEDGGYEIDKNRDGIFEDYMEIIEEDDYNEYGGLLCHIINSVYKPKLDEAVKSFNYHDNEEFYTNFIIKNFVENKKYDWEDYDRYTRNQLY